MKFFWFSVDYIYIHKKKKEKKKIYKRVFNIDRCDTSVTGVKTMARRMKKKTKALGARKLKEADPRDSLLIVYGNLACAVERCHYRYLVLLHNGRHFRPHFVPPLLQA